MTEAEELEYLRLLKEKASAGLVVPPAQAVHQFSAGQTMPRQPSRLADVPAGALSGMKDLWTGAQQRFYEATGNDPMVEALRGKVEAQRQQEEIDALTKGPPSLAFGFGEVAGKTAPAVGAAFLPGGQTWTGATAIGALQGLLEPSASGAETWRNTGLGAASAFGGTAATRALAPRTRIAEPRQALNVSADKVGEPLSGGERTGLDYVQRAEAHAYWNPLTRNYRRKFTETQDKHFVKEMLKAAGLPEAEIPTAAFLSPEILKKARIHIGRELDKNFVGKTYSVRDMTPAFGVAQRKAYFSSVDKEVEKLVKDAAQDVLKYKQAAPPNLVGYRGEIVQELLEDLKEGASTAFAKGSKRGGESILEIHDALVGALRNPELYKKYKEHWSRLMTIEDTLRGSKQMAAGVPDSWRLAHTMERDMPGSVILNRSGMADLGRAGEATRGVTALPERVTGIPRISDIGNAATYFRFNNPAARAGFQNPKMRDLAEAMIRYLPYSTGTTQEAEEEARRWYKDLRGQ